MRPCLSLVMPVFNEERTISESVDRVLKQPFVSEVIIVDDGSTDGTSEILQQKHDDRILVVSHDRNIGKGAALRTGFQYATADYVGIQDGDLEYDPVDLERLLIPLENGLADVVYGSRFISSDARRVHLFWHSVGNRLLTLTSNAFSNLNLSDMETCYKVFTRDLIQSVVLEEDRFGFEPEITIKLAARGARIYEVGISYAGRGYAEGKKITWRDGLDTGRCILKYGVLERSRRRRRRSSRLQAPWQASDSNS